MKIMWHPADSMDWRRLKNVGEGEGEEGSETDILAKKTMLSLDAPCYNFYFYQIRTTFCKLKNIMRDKHIPVFLSSYSEAL